MWICRYSQLFRVYSTHNDKIYVYSPKTLDILRGGYNKITKTEGGINMRIILDTDKKTITVPWNYQDKLNAMNAMIMEVTGDESKKKTFKGYINDIWNECMADSDKHVVTGKKPPKPDKKG